ncbi:MAG: hypothetical protein ACXAC8_03010 [Candidatus Hodarchaeales archaeon]
MISRTINYPIPVPVTSNYVGIDTNFSDIYSNFMGFTPTPLSEVINVTSLSDVTNSNDMSLSLIEIYLITFKNTL